mgnify:CR=1 FL=1
MVDYVHKDSLGLMSASMTVVSTCASLLATTGTIQLQEEFRVVFIYVAIGCIVLMAALFAMIGLKDVHTA